MGYMRLDGTEVPDAPRWIIWLANLAPIVIFLGMAAWIYQTCIWPWLEKKIRHWEERDIKKRSLISRLSTTPKNLSRATTSGLKRGQRKMQPH